jgi:V8-like Glu-specific endopeptidase
MADLEPWVDGLLQNAHRVCRVEIDTNAGPVFGTAFLVGPAAIITNYHVFEPVIRGEQGQATDRGIRASAGNARFRFDYRRLPDGSVTEGKTYGVHGASASDWLLDASPVSGADR